MKEMSQSRTLADQAWRLRAQSFREKLTTEEVQERIQTCTNLLEQAVHLAGQANAHDDHAVALERLAHIRNQTGRSDDAYALYQQAEEIARAGGNRFLEAHAIRHRADMERHNENFENAESMYLKAIKLLHADPSSDANSIANAYRPLAITLEETGRTRQAIETWRIAKSWYEKSGILAGVEECQNHLQALNAT